MTRNAARTETTMLLSDYAVSAAETDRLPEADLKPVLLGLFGEVGSVMATSKKHHREGRAYSGYRQAVEEEFGDALWYLAALCKRLRIPLDDLFSKATSNDAFRETVAAGTSGHGTVARVVSPSGSPALDQALLALGLSAAGLLSIADATTDAEARLIVFARDYLHALHAASVTFGAAAGSNLAKARGRFILPDIADLPAFDGSFPADERLPDQFEIVIRQRSSGKTCLQWNGVFIGDPLTDNIRDADGYRFHDVFHFANAAILHWSPTFRGLIKRKRKSRPDVDEAQDSGRAIVVEEGLSAWIFSCAKELDFFNGQSSVSFDLLKTISQFVRGYEVEACPLKLWEECILKGFEVFREVKKNNGGVVIADRPRRQIAYRPLGAGEIP